MNEFERISDNSDRKVEISRFEENVRKLTKDAEPPVGYQPGFGVSVEVTYPEIPEGFRAFVRKDYSEFGIRWRYAFSIFNVGETVYAPEEDTYIFYGIRNGGEFKKIIIHLDQHIPESADTLSEQVEAIQAMEDNVRLELDFVEECPTEEIASVNKSLATSIPVNIPDN